MSKRTNQRRRYAPLSQIADPDNGNSAISTPIVGSAINLVSGLVEVRDSKKIERLAFTDGLAVGDTLDECMRDFQFYATFRGRDNYSQYEKYEELQKRGCVRVVEMTILKKIGESQK